MGDGVSRSLIPLMAEAVTRSPAAVGLVQASARLPWLLVALPVGYLVDSRGYRSTSIAALVVKVGAAGALILAGMLASVPLLAAAAFLVVSAEVAFDTSVHGSVVYLLSSQDRTRGNSALYSWQATTGQFLGPGLGGLLFAPLRYLAPLVSASMHAAALVPLAAGRPVPRRPRTGAVAQESLRAALLSGFRPLFADRGLRWTTLIGTISMLAYGLWTSTFVSYVTTRAGIDQPAWVFGVLMACPAIGAVGVGFIAVRLVRRFSAFAGVVGLVVGQTFLFLPALAHAGPTGLGLGLAVYGASLGLWNSGVLAYRQAHVVPELYGRATAAYRVTSWGASPLGALLGAAVLSSGSVSVSFAIGAALVLMQAAVIPGAAPLISYRG